MFLEDADFLLNFSLPAGWNVVIFFLGPNDCSESNKNDL